MAYISRLSGRRLIVKTWRGEGPIDPPVPPPVPPPEPEPEPEPGAQTVTISWNLNGGTDGNGNPSIPDSVLEIGSEIPIPTAVREGYTFNGWWNGNVQLAQGTFASADVTYTAVWTEQSQVDPDQPPEVDPQRQAEYDQIDSLYPLPANPQPYQEDNIEIDYSNQLEDSVDTQTYNDDGFINIPGDEMYAPEAIPENYTLTYNPEGAFSTGVE